MNCSTAREQLQLLLDGRLTESEAADLQQHLAGCEGCREQFEEWKALQEALGALPPVEPPADLLPRMKAAVRREAAETSQGGGAAPSTVPGWFRPGRWRAVAAVLMLGLGVALLIHERPTRREVASGSWAAGDDVDHPARTLEEGRHDIHRSEPKTKAPAVVEEETEEDRDAIDRSSAPREKYEEKARKNARKSALYVTDADAADKRGASKRAGAPAEEAGPSSGSKKAGRRVQAPPGRGFLGGLKRPQGDVRGRANDSFASDEALGLYDLALARLAEAEKASVPKSGRVSLEVKNNASKAVDAVSKAPRDVVVVLRGDQALARLKSWAAGKKLDLRDLPVTPIKSGDGRRVPSGQAQTGNGPPPLGGGGEVKAPTAGGPATNGHVFLITVPEVRLAALEASLASLGKEGISLQRLTPRTERPKGPSKAGTSPAAKGRKEVPPSAPAAPKKLSRSQDSKARTVRLLLVVPNARR